LIAGSIAMNDRVSLGPPLRRDIVVIGASAGGVRALCKLVALLPEDFPAAILVVLHIGAHSSNLPTLLSIAGRLPARHAEQGDVVRAGEILVAPPDHHLLFSDGAATLTRNAREHHTRPAVDPLFRSAAVGAGARVIGVVLTGRLDDGSAGLQAIKASGGLAVVQDPADCEEPSMPQHALESVEVDLCLPLAGIAAALVERAGETVTPANPPPPQLVREHAISMMEGNAMEPLSSIAKPSNFACPDCHGGLWEIGGSAPPRYRCHTGHAFSLRSLQEVHAVATEDALWSAIRALIEKEALLRKVAALDRSAGDAARAASCEAEAAQIAAQAAVLRQLVETTGVRNRQPPVAA
jgi:two-component system chemotaxis response regulator CheB